MATRLEQLQAKKAALKAQLDEIAKAEARAASAAKEKTKKADDAVKLLLGVGLIAYVKAGHVDTLSAVIDLLEPRDKFRVKDSTIYKQLLGLAESTSETQTQAGEAVDIPEATEAPTEAPTQAVDVVDAFAEFLQPAPPRIATVDTPLTAQYEDRNAVRALGARFDAAEKKWYAPAGSDLNAFARWL